MKHKIANIINSLFKQIQIKILLEKKISLEKNLIIILQSLGLKILSDPLDRTLALVDHKEFYIDPISNLINLLSNVTP